jgi:hypothetical protein
MVWPPSRLMDAAKAVLSLFCSEVLYAFFEIGGDLFFHH